MEEFRLLRISQLVKSEASEKKTAKKIEIKTELCKETSLFGFELFFGGRWVLTALVAFICA